VDHRPLAGLDDVAGLGQVDQLTQLGLGGERSLAEAAARRDRVADQDQELRDRAEHLGEGDQHGGGHQRDPFGVLPAHRARCDADHHERHGHHHQDGRGHGPPATDHLFGDGVTADDQVGHHHRDQDDRADLAEKPEEQRRVHVSRGVLNDRQQARGPGLALGGDLFGAGLREGRERCLGTAEEAGDDDEDGCYPEQPDIDGGHASGAPSVSPPEMVTGSSPGRVSP
jgi:hypothetical protein